MPSSSTLISNLCDSHAEGAGPSSSVDIEFIDDDWLMKENLMEMFPSSDIKLMKEAVHDSIELKETVDTSLS